MINIKDIRFSLIFARLKAARRVASRDGRNEKLDWLRKYRPFANGMPVDDTIARVVRAIEPEQFNRAFLSWVNEVREASGQAQIALDGKTLRRSHDGEKHTALHSITAWGHECGLVLAQMRSSGKKNEQSSVMAMLELLQVKGAHITADAMNTQKKIAQKIHEKGGDYTLSLKANHKTLCKEIQAYFRCARPWAQPCGRPLAVHKFVRNEFEQCSWPRRGKLQGGGL